jgi:uncharacterized repeat protein (TIGR03803 family)
MPSTKVAIILLLIALACAAQAQGVRTVCYFAGTNGADLERALTLGSDGNFYGTTRSGGICDCGTVFKVTTNGTLTSLVSFAFTNGAYPMSSLTLGNDGGFYGTTSLGGLTNLPYYSWGMGTVFRVTTNGSLTTLASFALTNGAKPWAGLTLGNDGNFYGTTAGGGSGDYGAVFKVTTAGALTLVASLTAMNAEPQAGLTLGGDGNFYGTTPAGGLIGPSTPSGWGTVFSVTPRGSVNTLVVFDHTNGYEPQAALTLGDDGNFYGTTVGTIFKMTPSGALTVLTNFASYAGLTLGDDGCFYGTSAATVFKVTTNGTLTPLYTLPNPSVADLTMGNDGNFYGTTQFGGPITNSGYTGGMGTIFSVPGPPVTIQPQGQTLVAGGGATYFVTVASAGPPPFAFQWSLNGSPIPGATTSSLTISQFDVTSAGRYSVTVTNSSGSQTVYRNLRLVNSPVVRMDGVDVGGGVVSRIASAQITMFSAFGCGSSIFYTLDGSAPSYLSTPYQGPFAITQNTTIRAIAYDAAFFNSAEAAPITVQMVPIYELTASTPGGGTISVSPPPYSGADRFVSNTLVTVTATPSSGWSFLGWLGDAAGANPVAQLSMSRDMTVQAVFGTTVTSNVLGAGQLWSEPQVAVSPYGTTLSVAGIPQAGNYLTRWAGALTGSNNPNTLLLTSPTPIVSALFAPLSTGQYALTVLPQGLGHVTISPYTNRFNASTPVTVTATPDSGQIFAGWSGDASGSQNPLSLTITQSMVIAANFSGRPRLDISPPLNRMAEQGFRFSVLGELGMTYRVDSSSNLSIWVPVGWLTNILGISQFLDPSALTNPAQSYRAVTQ